MFSLCITMGRLARVSGYLCVDSQGLLLSSEGTAKASAAAHIATISQLAEKLEPEGKSPVVRIETEKT